MACQLPTHSKFWHVAMRKVYTLFFVSDWDLLSLPEESWRSGSGEEAPLSGLFVWSLCLCFRLGTVTCVGGRKVPGQWGEGAGCRRHYSMLTLMEASV